MYNMRGINLNTNNKLKNIILVGMTCSGKTSVAKYISEITDYSFLDTDEVMQSEASSSINDIFTNEGEECFRSMEHELVHKLAKYEKYIIATGGGIPVFYNNMDLLNEIGITVCLNVDIEIIIMRAGKLADRPLLKKNQREVLQKMSKDRVSFYNKADIIVNASNEDICTLGGIIIEKVQEYLNNI